MFRCFREGTYGVAGKVNAWIMFEFQPSVPGRRGPVWQREFSRWPEWTLWNINLLITMIKP